MSRRSGRSTRSCASAGCAATASASPSTAPPASTSATTGARPHACKGLANSTIRQIHWILSGALAKAVHWRWLSVNPTELADKPPLPHSNPDPPSAEDAARLLNVAWKNPGWGTLVWLAMTTGVRRGELCGLRWSRVDLDAGVVTYRRGVAQSGAEIYEKDTKTHQQRRVALDSDTVEILRAHHDRAAATAQALGVLLSPDAFVFSPVPDSSQPFKPDTITQKASTPTCMPCATTPPPN